MAIALGELGQPGPMWEVFEETRARAERLRYVYALLVLDSMTVPWLAMAGRFDEAEARLTSMIELRHPVLAAPGGRRHPGQLPGARALA